MVASWKLVPSFASAAYTSFTTFCTEPFATTFRSSNLAITRLISVLRSPMQMDRLVLAVELELAVPMVVAEAPQ